MSLSPTDKIFTACAIAILRDIDGLVLMHWSYIFLALTHQYTMQIYIINIIRLKTHKNMCAMTEIPLFIYLYHIKRAKILHNFNVI